MKYSDESNVTRDLIRAVFVKEQKDDSPTIFTPGHLLAALLLLVLVIALARFGVL